MSMKIHPKAEPKPPNDSDYTQDDLRSPEQRQSCWDQIYPRDQQRFRPKHYLNSQKWSVVNERFLTGDKLKHSWTTWIGGTYKVSLHFPEDDALEAVLTIELDFVDERRGWSGLQVLWIIIIPQSHHVAYPGVHRGALTMRDPARYFALVWHTPLFSPYVKSKNPDRGEVDKLSLAPVLGECKDANDGKIRNRIHEKVQLGSGDKTVLVLQEALKDIAVFLIYGPHYSDMKEMPMVELDIQSSPYDKKSPEFF